MIIYILEEHYPRYNATHPRVVAMCTDKRKLTAKAKEMRGCSNMAYSIRQRTFNTNSIKYM